MSAPTSRPRLAVWKFASCDGCQLTLLDCEDELLAIAEAVDIAYFLEASTAVGEGPFDVSLVEGSITTPADVERIRHVRAVSGTLVTLGACATAGGVQALRDLASVEEFAASVYPRPSEIDALATSTPISAHVDVDLELRGCPIDPGQLVDLVAALLTGRRLERPDHSVCIECKQAGEVCVAVAAGTACLGPITRGGCGAICPRYARGCYGCFGPVDDLDPAAMTAALAATELAEVDQLRLLRTFNVGAPGFAEVAVAVEAGRREGAS